MKALLKVKFNLFTFMFSVVEASSSSWNKWDEVIGIISCIKRKGERKLPL